MALWRWESFRVLMTRATSLELRCWRCAWLSAPASTPHTQGLSKLATQRSPSFVGSIAQTTMLEFLTCPQLRCCKRLETKSARTPRLPTSSERNAQDPPKTHNSYGGDWCSI